MPRYIDIDKMNKWTEVDQQSCSRENCVSTSYDCNECYYNNGGAEDVTPVVHAEWLPMTNPIEWHDGREHFECSNCGIYHAPLKNERYCPYCAAKMDKENSR